MAPDPDATAATAAGAAPPVRLSIPSSTRHLRLARVTAATMASELSFGLADIEDLRVAVDELAALLIEDCPPDAVLELGFSTVDGALRVTGTVTGVATLPELPPAELHPVARELLDLVADAYEVAPAGAPRSFELTKRRRGPAT